MDNISSQNQLIKRKNATRLGPEKQVLVRICMCQQQPTETHQITCEEFLDLKKTGRY